VVASGRQRTVKLAVKAEWWKVLTACYERLRTWLAATAPQLESQGDFLRLLTRQPRPAEPQLRILGWKKRRAIGGALVLV
jgi:hypothetical protein